MFSNGYRRYVLGALTAVFTLNYVDRALMGLLMQPIKADLHLSDTQLGFLTGMAFALLYATLGIPVARWADRGNRVTLTAIAIALWGGTVAVCLYVSNFFQLMGARVLAGAGEAGCMPPTYSLLGDYFPLAKERTRAMAIYWLANPLAGALGYILGGWLNELYGWRVTFLVMGIPGLLLGILVKLTVTEPRIQATGQLAPHRPVPRMIDVACILWRGRSSRQLVSPPLSSTSRWLSVWRLGMGLSSCASTGWARLI